MIVYALSSLLKQICNVELNELSQRSLKKCVRENNVWLRRQQRQHPWQHNRPHMEFTDFLVMNNNSIPSIVNQGSFLGHLFFEEKKLSYCHSLGGVVLVVLVVGMQKL